LENKIDRFLNAQAISYPNALIEIKSGHKKGHWMWFIFPQLKGLGHSETSKYYAIEGLQEAKTYLNHEILGARLNEISEALLQLDKRDPHTIFGSPDDMKLKSSMTLFAKASGQMESVFHKVLRKYYHGEMDAITVALLKKNREST
jgi:uncharacterized protein (DUF1810 family)